MQYVNERKLYLDGKLLSALLLWRLAESDFEKMDAFVTGLMQKHW